MKIYLAGSFTHKQYVRRLAEKIRFHGHEVYCFCDEHEDVFKLSMKVREGGVHLKFTPQTALQHPVIQQIGHGNWKELEKADIVIVALPCGKSAHLEAGWAKGKGKRVYVYGFMTSGEFDAMYVMVDNVFDDSEFMEMMDVISI